MAKKKILKSKENQKINDLQQHSEDPTNQLLTTNQGLRVNDNQNTLKAGERGPSLLEDFIMREKITHFDHERIPERIVHARGSAAHGFFELYKPMGKYTRAAFLNDTKQITPVFVRFSTVAGSRGSTDLARDVRGFSVKFYTQEGNYDLVGNNMPVFFIQDAMKFPDLVHAVKPEPDNEIPQASSAHDTFWDFISLMPESAHMIMWLMSDRAIPRSYRMMEGFGVHTFRFINDQGKSHFVKFHWKPLLGVHSLAWDEAQNLSGKDPDFHRRDLWNAIAGGNFPQWELGVQLIDEKDEHKFDFDLLDPTKLIPEEIVPVQIIGKMTLNRNPDNFFAETEQVAFHPGHLVPGIDFSNDPLLQGRLFSYTDTQLSRLGSPNFHEIPINRPLVGIHNNQRDGHMRQMINKGKTSYEPNSLGGGCPFQAMLKMSGFTSFLERIDAKKIRTRSKSFMDHFGQATLFYNSQSHAEKKHITNALRFELGKVKSVEVRQRMVNILTQIDKGLADNVAVCLGLKAGAPAQPINHSFPADANPKDYQPRKVKSSIEVSPALSMEHTVKDSILTRQVAFLTAPGYSDTSLQTMKKALENSGAQVKIIAPALGFVRGAAGKEVPVDESFLTSSSVCFDAVFVPGGAQSAELLIENADAIHFINEAYKHCKAIAADKEGVKVLRTSHIGLNKKETDEPGIVTYAPKNSTIEKEFIKAIAAHRVWDREPERKVPA
ncbi:MAG: Catalase [Bacteroidota bacterium]|jgi:catalase|nr:Catalase [Bacteroidota bacterium]